jgi:glyceraldehyde 3-phosphate dehydrogenase
MTLRLGINGFGRIGRAVLRASLDKRFNDIEIVAVNDLCDVESNHHLLKYDSVHGRLSQKTQLTGNIMKLGDRSITFLAKRDPSTIEWGALGVDIVLECTGIFRKREQAELHIKGGAKKVLISSPATGEDITVVRGVNCSKLKPEHTIVSNGSCTTNCLAPVAKVIHEKFGIINGMMTTIHSYTRDQQLLDSPHDDMRRARAAAMNMVPTTTGAAKAIGLVMPELKGKLDGKSIRVPTPNVSLVDVTFNLEKSTTSEEINQALKFASENGSLQGILGYTDEPLVSIDFNGDTRSSIVDGPSTSVMNGNFAKILSWYDNEIGFSNRMLDIALLMAK